MNPVANFNKINSQKVIIVCTVVHLHLNNFWESVLFKLINVNRHKSVNFPETELIFDVGGGESSSQHILVTYHNNA